MQSLRQNRCILQPRRLAKAVAIIPQRTIVPKVKSVPSGSLVWRHLPAIHGLDFVPGESERLLDAIAKSQNKNT
jgi:hypothetical protein